MEIFLQQKSPHEVYDVDIGGPHEIETFLFWIFDKDRHLPEEMSLSFYDNLFYFRTREERLQWGMGFGLAAMLYYNPGEDKEHGVH